MPVGRESKPERGYRQLLVAQTARLLERGDVALHEAPGEEFFYRPGELLVARDRVRDLEGDLADLGAHEADVEDEDPVVVRYTLPGGTSVVDATRMLQKSAGDPAAAGPHHVVFGVPRLRGCPGRPASVAAPLDLALEGDGDGVVVAVVDTGQAAQSLQFAWAAGHVDVGPADEDLLDEDGDGVYDLEGGHGTFVAGIVGQVAPGVKVLARKALDTWGVADDLTVTKAIRRALDDGAHIVNLSLGGYALDDVPPLSLAGLLGRKERRGNVVFVAAAGNDAVDRPFYPAALPTVIGVAALGSRRRRAAFSNFGPWVDASAEGDRLISTFVSGEVMTDSDADGRGDVFSEPWAHWSGTSFAAPQVSAAIAARMSRMGESATDAAYALVLDPALPRRTGLGVQVDTPVRSHPARTGFP